MTKTRHPLLDPKALMRGLVLIGTLVAIEALFDWIDLKSMLGSQWVDAEVRGHGLAGKMLFIVAGAAFSGLGLPRQVVSFLGGYAFGFVQGCVLALVATLAGAITVFYYARFMGRDLLARRFPDRVRKVDAFLSGNPMTMALVLRLSPFSSNLVANLAAGVTGVRMVPFFAGSAIGYLPQTIIFSLLGGGISLNPVVNTAMSAALFVISTVLGIWLLRRYRSARGLPEDEDDIGGQPDDTAGDDTAPPPASGRDGAAA